MAASGWIITKDNRWTVGQLAVKGMKWGSCGHGVVAVGAQGWQMNSEGGENVVDLAIFKSSTIPTVLQLMDYEEICAFLEAHHIGMI